jgi:2-polyprenyl-3-methyl-5-hydroxy-6-metoxy-1,4-benzoquinol methylase
MSQALKEYRVAAAKCSGGISSSAIRTLVQRLIEERNLHGEIIDFGAGKADLLKQLFQLNRFSRLIGIDLYERSQDLPDAIDWHVQDLNEDTRFPGGAVDVVVCSEVIEHLENPRHVFRQLHRLLKPGGTLILTMPNQESIRSIVGLIFGGHFTNFLGNCYPAHITALLREDLRRICSETGFEPPKFAFTNEGAVPKLTFLSWQTISFGLLRGRLFSENVAMIFATYEP